LQACRFCKATRLTGGAEGTALMYFLTVCKALSKATVSEAGARSVSGNGWCVISGFLAPALKALVLAAGRFE
jgi:energy-converting hydrogenase Eha subunit G